MEDIKSRFNGSSNSATMQVQKTLNLDVIQIKSCFHCFSFTGRLFRCGETNLFLDIVGVAAALFGGRTATM